MTKSKVVITWAGMVMVILMMTVPAAISDVSNYHNISTPHCMQFVWCGSNDADTVLMPLQHFSKTESEHTTLYKHFGTFLIIAIAVAVTIAIAVIISDMSIICGIVIMRLQIPNMNRSIIMATQQHRFFKDVLRLATHFQSANLTLTPVSKELTMVLMFAIDEIHISYVIVARQVPLIVQTQMVLCDATTISPYLSVIRRAFTRACSSCTRKRIVTLKRPKTSPAISPSATQKPKHSSH